MKRTIPKSRIALQPFVCGQVWQMEGSLLHIGLVGKTLVHYKHFKTAAKRSPVSLTGKVTLEKYLQEQQAILLPQQLRAVSPTASR